MSGKDDDESMGPAESSFDTDIEPTTEDIGSPTGATDTTSQQSTPTEQEPASSPTMTELDDGDDDGEFEVEPSIQGSRVAQGTKPGRKPITTEIDPVRQQDISDLLNDLETEYVPAPKKTDLTAAIFYAGLPDGSDDFHDHLEAFGYVRAE